MESAIWKNCPIPTIWQGCSTLRYRKTVTHITIPGCVLSREKLTHLAICRNVSPALVPILFFVVIEATTQLLWQGWHAALLGTNVG